MTRRAIRLPLALVVLCPLAHAAPLTDGVRSDCYFRESLVAIRDWETLLEKWEAATPASARTPVLPVPENGDTVLWPNPIPAMLLPAADRQQTIQARLTGVRAEVGRAGRTETVAAGDTVVGYQYPGGGAKDRWYHAYSRRLDGLCAFRPKPAPFALRIEAPLDLKRGPNTLHLALRNLTDAPLALAVSLTFRSRAAQDAHEARNVTLAPGQTASVLLNLELTTPGGGLLILALETAGKSYWLPFLTGVEDVDAVLTSLDQILADTPDQAAATKLADLRRREEAQPVGDDWRGLFEEAGALREELLLRRLPFETLLFVKRKPFDSEQPFMDAHHLPNRPGGGIYRLSPVRPNGQVTPVVDSLGQGIYRDICMSWDAHQLLFSFGNGNDTWDGGQSYHLYQVNVDGTGLRQLTFGTHNDCEPLYLPNGQIAFTSDRSEHYVMCGGDRHAPNLYVMEADGSHPRELSFNVFNDFTPSLLPDGRLLYGHWEYNERSVTTEHKPFTMFPDGSLVAPYYGNATIRPNVVMFPRPVPGSRQVMALFTAHHGQTHGPIGLIDVGKGVDGPEPITVLTPNVPVTGEHAEDSQYGWYSDPQPLSETTYLCSYTPTVQPWLASSWALYVGDPHGNLALVYRDPDISCAEPVPLAPRPRPGVLPQVAPPDTDATDAEAALLLRDVYYGLPGVPRGAAKYLRVLEDVPRISVPHGGVICTSGTSIYTIKRIFGTVPIEADGSAYFVVPANRNVYFEVLDQEGLEIQRMRSVVCLKPRELRACAGCHEPRTSAPQNRSASAAGRPASRPLPPAWGTSTLSFLRDVQPLLNAKCVRCHAYGRTDNRVILTDDLTDQFTVGYEELLPYLAVANSMRFDNPEDVEARPPYTYGSKVSPLTKVLRSGHHGVELSGDDWQRLAVWIDANAVYYDRYQSDHWPNRSVFTEAVRKPLAEVYGRRCGDCHAESDGRYATWWLSLNRHDVRLSRALQAPLARAAGGWQRCDGTVFATTHDPDYCKLLAGLTALRDELARYPREDLLSLQGTDAGRQVVTLPEPPPSHPAPASVEAGWVYLSDLPWESATAGWTCNGDLVPRRDKDVEDHPLGVGLRRYRKGLGTHAPSEIVYRLDGRTTEFRAVITGAEAGDKVVFQVWGDDRLLYDSGVMHGLREIKDVDLPLTGVQRLRLVVTDAGDGIGCDMANWAGARILPTASR